MVRTQALRSANRLGPVNELLSFNELLRFRHAHSPSHALMPKALLLLLFVNKWLMLALLNSLNTPSVLQALRSYSRKSAQSAATEHRWDILLIDFTRDI